MYYTGHSDHAHTKKHSKTRNCRRINQDGPKVPGTIFQTRQNKRVQHKSQVQDDVRVTQQKGMRVPLQLQEAVEKEIQKLLEEGHI